MRHDSQWIEVPPYVSLADNSEYVRIVNMSEGQAPATHHGSNLIVHLCTSLKFNFPSAVPLCSLLILLSGIVSQVNHMEVNSGLSLCQLRKPRLGQEALWPSCLVQCDIILALYFKQEVFLPK